MALAVERVELGPFGTNTYLVRVSAAASEAVVVDPSGDAETILRLLSERGATCAAILVTHAHPGATVVHPGHGPETTLGAELSRNPFLAELRSAGAGT